MREIAVNPKKNAPEKTFIVPIVEFYSNASHQNDFQIGRHPAHISPNLTNLSIGAPKLLKKLLKFLGALILRFFMLISQQAVGEMKKRM